jgi:ribosomal protein L29
MIEYNRYQDLRTYTDEELKELLKRVDMEKFILETQLLINKQ